MGALAVCGLMFNAQVRQANLAVNLGCFGPKRLVDGGVVGDLGGFDEPGIHGLPPSAIAGLVLEIAECCATDPASVRA
jgi:hypothetical protein